MALSVNSKIRELLENPALVALIDRLVPGLTSHPLIGVAKNFTLAKCAKLLPDVLTPEVMEKILDALASVAGGAAETDAASAPPAARVYDFDEIIGREGTNSVKYDAAPVLNPLLPADFVPMWIADMDFAVAEPIREAMKARIDRKILGYSMPLSADYYIAVMDYLERHHGHKLDFDEIVFSSGVITAMKAAVQRFTSEGDGVIINTPSYMPFDASVKQFGRTPLYSPLVNTDGYFTFDYADIERKAKDPRTKMFFLCNPHNPTGRVWREDELRRVAQICFDNGVFVFSDEIHCDITRAGQKHIPLAVLYPERKDILTATAPSKTFNLAGNQLANLLFHDKELAQEWRMARYCGEPNPLSLDACVAAYTLCDDWLEQMNAYVDENFRYMQRYLAAHLPQAKFRIPEGTYLAWTDLRALGLSDAELKDRISRAGLFLEYADDFVRDGDGFVRMNLACPRSVLSRALKIFCEALGGTSEELWTPPSDSAPRSADGDGTPAYDVAKPSVKEGRRGLAALFRKK